MKLSDSAFPFNFSDFDFDLWLTCSLLIHSRRKMETIVHWHQFLSVGFECIIYSWKNDWSAFKKVSKKRCNAEYNQKRLELIHITFLKKPKGPFRPMCHILWCSLPTNDPAKCTFRLHVSPHTDKLEITNLYPRSSLIWPAPGSLEQPHFSWHSACETHDPYWLT